MSQIRQLAAIMFTDIVGYTALMGKDEQKAFELLKINREIQKPIIELFNGQWIKELGDGVMASFNTVSDAVNAAVKIQEDCKAAKKFQLRIGIHQGEIVVEAGDIFGDAVNIAARIQSAAKPGAIYISESVHHNVSNKNHIQTKFVKEETLKNVKEPVRMYEVMTANNAESSVENNLKNATQTKVTTQKSIAVLPFANMSSDPEQEYFSEGISEEIINMLAQVPGLKVAGRTSSFSFKGKNVDLRLIGEQLNVNHILEGSVRKSGNKLRITAQLVKVEDGFHLYSEKFDRELQDIFEIQDEISLAILNAIKIKLFSDEKEAVLKKYTDNVEAYQLYLQGRYHVNKYNGTEAFLNGIKYYEEAIKASPDYALAYAGMAYCYMELWMDSLLPPEQCVPQLQNAVKRALELDDTITESNLALANLKVFFEWEFRGVNDLFQKILSINPNSSDGHRMYAFYLLFTGNGDGACKHATIAYDLDPFSVAGNWEIAWIFIWCHQFEKGMEIAKRLMQMEPGFFGSHFITGCILMYQKKYEEAKPFLEEAVRLYPIFMTLRMLATVHLKTGNDAKCIEIVAEMEALGKTTAISNRDMGEIYTVMGEYDVAVKYFEKGIENRDGMMLFAKYDILHTDERMYVPQIAEIIEKVEAFKMIN
ncbi:MAG: adenylate/guanylate cyclase domain-containing protein [Saprospiraceae bacterium]